MGRVRVPRFRGSTCDTAGRRIDAAGGCRGTARVAQSLLTQSVSRPIQIVVHVEIRAGRASHINQEAVVSLKELREEVAVELLNRIKEAAAQRDSPADLKDLAEAYATVAAAAPRRSGVSEK